VLIIYSEERRMKMNSVKLSATYESDISGSIKLLDPTGSVIVFIYQILATRPGLPRVQ
jgi:hypothetical protein